MIRIMSALAILVQIVLLVTANEETAQVEITSSGDTKTYESHSNTHSETGPPVDAPSPHSTDYSETGQPVDPPLIFRTAEKPPSNQYWVTFKNESPDIIELVWDDGGRDGRLQGTINPGSSMRMGTFEGHVFFYRYPNQHKKEYICYMKNGKMEFTFKDAETRQQEAIQLEQEKIKFKKDYLEQTGRKWEAFYPRNPPIHHMYSGDFIGQKHQVTSNHSFYNCYPVTTNDEDIKKCRDDSIINFEWEVVSTSPRVLWLSPPFLSDYEIEHIKLIAGPKLAESTVGHGEGAYASSVRTSKGCFIDRCETDLIDWIFRRLADVTQIEESFLWHMVGSENLQVLKYNKTQEFKPHSDYNTNREQMRYQTFLMYLNTLEEDQGGATTFPLGNLTVVPKKGHVATFYSVLDDGNSDYMSLHASTPLKYGVKWSAPVWIWDPSQS